MNQTPTFTNSSLEQQLSILDLHKQKDIFSAFSATSKNPYLKCHRKLVPLSQFYDYHQDKSENSKQSQVINLRIQHISSGIPSFDSIFKGGIEVGQITQFYGQSGTGKTQLCLQLCIYAALDPPFGLGARSLYISTQKAANQQRLAQLIRLICMRHRADQQIVSQRMIIKHEQPEMVKALLKSKGRMYGIKLICIDNVATLCDQFQYQDEYGNERVDFIKRSQFLLTTAGILKQLACELQAAIVLTNNVSSKFDQQVQQEHPLEEIDDVQDANNNNNNNNNDKIKIPNKSQKEQQYKVQQVSSAAINEKYLWNIDQPQKWNQSKIGNYIKKIIPKLGVIWSNCVNSRIQLVKHTKGLDQSVLFRFLKVEFCPYVPTGSYTRFVITDSGLIEHVQREQGDKYQQTTKKNINFIKNTY